MVADGPPPVIASICCLAIRRVILRNLIAASTVGLSNYVAVFTDRVMLEAFRNNILFWILIATPLTVAMGLLVAVLADRSKYEKVAKSLIFMPMAISFVGASVIWNFMYEVKPVEIPQIGLLNAIVVASGRSAACLDCLYGHRAMEQSVPGRDCCLAAGWLCDGAFLCRH